MTAASAPLDRTITRFYMQVVAHHVNVEPVVQDWGERANRVYQRLGARDLPLRYYSEARLKSVEARAGWVEPDLRPLTDETTIGR